MLYVTTAEGSDAYTAARTLANDWSPEGGAFVPYTLPVIDKVTLRQFAELSFGQVTAKILNLFFPCQLSGWDVDFVAGRNAIRIKTMDRMLAVAELWHNPVGDIAPLIRGLYQRLCPENVQSDIPTDWPRIAVGIAVLFGIYSDLCRNGVIRSDESFDICVNATELTGVCAAWYARKMGVPVGRIICTCTDSGCLWDLLHRGYFSPNGQSDTLLRGVERLIFAALGQEQCAYFRSCCQSGRTYSLSEELLPILNSGFYCSVISPDRADATVNSVYRSNGYILDPDTALCYGAIQDFRARSGQTCITLLPVQRDPKGNAKRIADATGVPVRKLWPEIHGA